MEPASAGLIKLQEINRTLAFIESTSFLVGGSEWLGRSVDQNSTLLAIQAALVAVAASQEEEKPGLAQELKTLFHNVQSFSLGNEKTKTLDKISTLFQQVTGHKLTVRKHTLSVDSTKSSEPEVLNLLQLPMDVLNNIFSFISEEERAILREVCRRFRNSPVLTESKFTEATVLAATRHGATNLLSWLFSRINYDTKRSLGPKICKAAARAGKLEVLQWARANGCPWSATCSKAAAGGHLEVLQWAHANGCPWNELTCSEAAKGGHLAVLKWARANGCPWDELTCSEAAARGHLAVLKWARANHCPWWDIYICADAAKKGHLKVLQWARANGGTWGATCSIAAARGHLAVLKWAHAKGCPWNELTCSKAAEGSHLKVLKWALTHGAPHDIENLKMTSSTKAKQWLEENYDKLKLPSQNSRPV